GDDIPPLRSAISPSGATHSYGDRCQRVRLPLASRPSDFTATASIEQSRRSPCEADTACGLPSTLRRQRANPSRLSTAVASTETCCELDGAYEIRAPGEAL